MQPSRLLELTLDGIAQGGAGVGRVDERVVFASGGLPGERVRVQIDEQRPTYALGRVVEVLERSPDRIEPRLPGADHMPWQAIAYPAQLRFKQQIVADQLAKIGRLRDTAVAATLPAARPWGYRNSARLHGQAGEIGYFAADTRSMQPIEHDPLLLPVLNEALAALRAAMHEHGLPAPEEIIVRASEGHGYALAAIRGAPAEAQSLHRLAARWRARCPALAGVAVAGGPTLGADHLIEELDGLAFRLRPTSFFQVNVGSAEALLGLARAGIGDLASGSLLDLYCGAGAFTLPMARHAREVVGIEEFAGAVEDALASAELNGIANVEFLAGRVEQALAEVEAAPDAVLLDPPRRGCHPQAIAELIRLAPARIAYVSCHPATLARDLKLLTAGGYAVASVQPIDLFPQTAHIECVTVLSRT